MIFVSLVPKHEIEKVWPKIRKFVASIEFVSEGRATVTSIFNSLMEDRYLLWVVFDFNEETKQTEFKAFCCTSIKQYPGKKMLHLDYIGGKNMRSWRSQLDDTLASFSASQECNGIESIGRMGWGISARKLGWKPKYILYEKEFVAPAALQEMKH